MAVKTGMPKTKEIFDNITTAKVAEHRPGA
jgi:hypothetical protein